MQLSAELFTQVVEALRSDKTGHEKRTAPRVGLRALVEVLLKPGTRTPAVRMRVRDLSASGIGLIYNRELASSSEFVVRLPSGRADQAPIYISCIVAHCRKAAADTYAVGGRIVRVLSDDEAALLAVNAM